MRYYIVFLLLFVFTKAADLSEISEKLNNPLAEIWSFYMQNDYQITNYEDGSSVETDHYRLQPVLAFPIKDQWNFILRPTFNINQVGGETKFGDSQLIFLVGNTEVTKHGNWIYGIGGVISLPTGADIITSEQYAAGVSAVNLLQGKHFSGGLLYQYFSGIEGNNDVSKINMSSLQYFFSYKFNYQWQLAMNPTITFNHNASSGNQLTLPVGLSLQYTGKVGKMPLRFGVGFETDIINPNDNIKNDTRFVLILVPVVPKYFGLWK